MSTFDRSGTALLVIDVQAGVVGDAYQRHEVVANINTAIAKARAASVPVIWVQHADEWMAVDSCGGFFGDDLQDNGYDTDLKKAALDWLTEAGIKAAEEYQALASRASYAQGGV